MKKRLFFIISSLLLIIFDGIADSVTFDVGDLRYTIDTETRTAKLYGPVSSSKTITNLVIPDYIDYNGSQIPVISIKGDAFYSNKNLRGLLTIGENIQTIGNYAFYLCSGLSGSLTIPNSVQTIGESAFLGCDGLTGDLIIPESVTEIGKSAFFGCSGFNGTLTLPSKLQSIEEGAFYGCDGLIGDLIIPKSVTSIGSDAFYYCYGFNGCLEIGGPVTYIGNDAFCYCMGLTGDLKIPETVTNIGINAFYLCKGLTGDLIIPESVTSIGNEAFSACSGFSSVYSFSINPPECGSKAFYSLYNKPLFVPQESILSYQTASEWEKFTYLYPIQIEAIEITINKTELSLLIGQEVTLMATLTPEDASTAIVWSVETGGENVISVSQDGKVAALSVGTATVVAAAGSVSSTCKVTVYGSDDVTVKPGSGTTTGSSDNSPAENTYEGASLIGNDLTLRVGQTGVIELELPQDLTEIPVFTWYVEAKSPTVASMVNNSNTQASFLGDSMGSVSYEVSLNSKTLVRGTIMVIAENPMTSLRLNPEEISVAQNADPFQITAEYTPENADPSLLTWTSSQLSVATVSNDGTVTILAQGETTITARATDGSELSAECQVTVTKPIDENFDFDFSDAVMDDMEGITIYLGDTYQFKPQAKDGYELPDNIQWSSDELQTVSVTSEGLVKGETLGTANITASAMVNGKEVTATCMVKVIPIPASTIEIDGQGVKILKTTGTLQLKATVMPGNTTLADVTWQSSDPAVAQVSDQGLVTALTPGEVTITAFVTNQPTVIDEYKIQVQERLLGDANDNGVVNVADVGTISDYIVKKSVANFCFVNADVIPDKQITTADVTATIEIIFNDTPSAMSMTRSASNHLMTGDSIVVDDFNTNGKESTEIGIRLENSTDYVGIQGSIQIPEGMTVERIERGPGAAGHILNYNITDDGNLIFILYSLDNLPLARGNDCLVNLFLKADESCEGIEIEDILASDINARQYALTSTRGINPGFTSDLEEIGDRQIRIHSQAGCITVSNAQGELVEIYTFDGKTMVGSTAISDKETYKLAPGIYIVRVRDINVKLVVK